MKTGRVRFGVDAVAGYSGKVTLVLPCAPLARRDGHAAGERLVVAARPGAALGRVGERQRLRAFALVGGLTLTSETLLGPKIDCAPACGLIPRTSRTKDGRCRNGSFPRRRGASATGWGAA